MPSSIESIGGSFTYPRPADLSAQQSFNYQETDSIPRLSPLCTMLINWDFEDTVRQTFIMPLDHRPRWQSTAVSISYGQEIADNYLAIATVLVIC